MVRTVQITGIAVGRTTPISLGAYLGNVKIAGITQARILHTHSSALSMHALAAHSHAASGHALAAHSHALSGHALANHSHDMFAAITSGLAFDASQALVLSGGTLRISGPTGGAPPTSGDSAGTPAGGIDGVGAGVPAAGIDGVTGGIATGAAVDAAQSMWAYTVDSNGRYVLAATHPIARHIVLKPHGDAGPRIELGDAIVAPDILEITYLLQLNSGGIF